MFFLLDYPKCENRNHKNLWWKTLKFPRIFVWCPLIIVFGPWFENQRYKSRRVVAEGREDKDSPNSINPWEDWEKESERCQRLKPQHLGDGREAPWNKNPKKRIRFESKRQVPFVTYWVWGPFRRRKVFRTLPEIYLWRFGAMGWRLSIQSHLLERANARNGCWTTGMSVSNISKRRGYISLLVNQTCVKHLLTCIVSPSNW